MGAAIAVRRRAARCGFSLALTLLCAWPFALAQAPRAVAEAQAKVQAAPKLPPRRPIAGIEVLETTSSVVQVAEPGPKRELVVTFAFPGRVRILESTQSDHGVERRFRYRYGDTLYQHDLKDPASTELTGAARTDALAEMELRRAVLLWPDGFEWKADGETRSGSVGEAGSVQAHVGASAKQPDRIAIVAENGAERVSFRSVQWRESGGRVWPASFELWRAGKHVATETIAGTDVTKTYIDLFFMPTDRRDRATERDAMLGLVREQELPRFCARRVELTQGTSWPEARREIEAVLADWSARVKERALALDPGWTVELDDAARPKAVLVRLATIPDPAPEGFSTSAVRQARVMFVEGLTDATAARLEELRRAVPASATAQHAYLRIRPDGGPVLIVLPLAP